MQTELAERAGAGQLLSHHNPQRPKLSRRTITDLIEMGVGPPERSAGAVTPERLQAFTDLACTGQTRSGVQGTATARG
jgi:hypothetical protein